MVKETKKEEKKGLSKREQDLVKEAYNQGLAVGYDSGLIKGYQRASQLVMVTLSNDLNALITPTEEEGDKK